MDDKNLIDDVLDMIVTADSHSESVFSSVIEAQLGVSGREVRNAVKILRRQGNLIYSNHKGYRLARNADEVLEIITDLQNRARSMLTTVQKLMMVYKQMKQREQTELFAERNA